MFEINFFVRMVPSPIAFGIKGGRDKMDVDFEVS